MIVFFGAALAASTLIGSLESYRSCTSGTTIRLGSANAESADTIIRAARSICKPQWETLQRTAGVGLGVPAIDAQAGKWRTDAEDSAIAALLEARARNGSVTTQR